MASFLTVTCRAPPLGRSPFRCSKTESLQEVAACHGKPSWAASIMLFGRAEYCPQWTRTVLPLRPPRPGLSHGWAAAFRWTRPLNYSASRAEPSTIASAKAACRPSARWADRSASSSIPCKTRRDTVRSASHPTRRHRRRTGTAKNSPGLGPAWCRRQPATTTRASVLQSDLQPTVVSEFRRSRTWYGYPVWDPESVLPAFLQLFKIAADDWLRELFREIPVRETKSPEPAAWRK